MIWVKLLFSKIQLVPSWVWIGILFSLGVIGLHSWVEGQFDDARQEGADIQVAQDMAVTLDRVEAAHEASNEVSNPTGSARYDECVLSARTPENCKRFLPH